MFCKRQDPWSCRCSVPWCIAAIASLDFARCQDVRVVASEEGLMTAFQSNAAHIHIVSHLDLRACRGDDIDCGSGASAWVYRKPSFVSLTVRCSAFSSVQEFAWAWRGAQATLRVSVRRGWSRDDVPGSAAAP